MTVLVTLLAAGAASADNGNNGNKSCSILSDCVYRQVVAAGHSGGRIATLTDPMPAPAVCADTARAVSKGFTQAMAERNHFIIWPSPERQRGEVCLSHDLSQCFPNQDPLVPLISLYDAAFVVRQWRVVQATITASMPAGTASDVTRFDPAWVAIHLQRSLGRDPQTRGQID